MTLSIVTHGKIKHSIITHNKATLSFMALGIMKLSITTHHNDTQHKGLGLYMQHFMRINGPNKLECLSLESLNRLV